MTDIEGISEGRKQVALEKADEARREWMRAERAEAEVARLRAALEELLWYTNQLELAVYDPAEWPSTHGAVRAARAALQQEPKP